MTPNPLFSVLIANYNNGKYLMDAINSVYAQTYSNWEIILVDDASTDNSKELYKELEKDSRIHIFYNEENKGCGYTKRRCAELANGEILGFLDPDDALSADALETMIIEHLRNDGLALVYSNYFLCDEKLNVIQASTHQCTLPQGLTFLEYGKGAISHFVSFKQKSYQKTFGISPDIKMAVDYDLYYRLEEVGETKYIPNVLYYYRTGTGKNISLGNNAIKALFWSYVGMIDACRRRSIPIEEIVLPRFLAEISNYSKYESLYQSICNSKTYRLGLIITSPYRLIKRLLKK